MIWTRFHDIHWAVFLQCCSISVELMSAQSTLFHSPFHILESQSMSVSTREEFSPSGPRCRPTWHRILLRASDRNSNKLRHWFFTNTDTRHTATLKRTWHKKSNLPWSFDIRGLKTSCKFHRLKRPCKRFHNALSLNGSFIWKKHFHVCNIEGARIVFHVMMLSNHNSALKEPSVKRGQDEG